ncbi:RNA 2',3'-cyclic phosphodiesterase [Chloroflexota bacterium]
MELRSFIAIELPAGLIAELDSLEARLGGGGHYPVKWVEPRSIHLTLKFLGNIDSGRVGGIMEAMAVAAGGIRPFDLSVKGLGVFPDSRRVQVAWVGLMGEVDRLLALQERLETELSRLDFPAERRSFKPHLTIARLRERASPQERQGFGRLIAGTDFTPDSGFRVGAISLMRSQLSREGAVYSRLGSIGLE